MAVGRGLVSRKGGRTAKAAGLVCLALLSSAGATPDAVPNLPLWFSSSVFATAGGRGVTFDGKLAYDHEAQRQRIEFDDEMQENSRIVELWRGRDEIYIYSEATHRCQLVDWRWGALNPRLTAGGVWKGSAFDVARADNGSDILVQADVWVKETASGVPLVAYFHRRRSSQQGDERVVPLRLMGGSEEGVVSALFFSGFDDRRPSEDVFAIPAFCKNVTVELPGQRLHEPLVSGPDALVSMWLSSHAFGEAGDSPSYSPSSS